MNRWIGSLSKKSFSFILGVTFYLSSVLASPYQLYTLVKRWLFLHFTFYVNLMGCLKQNSYFKAIVLFLLGRGLNKKKNIYRPHLLSVFSVSLTISAIYSGEKMTISSLPSIVSGRNLLKYRSQSN